MKLAIPHFLSHLKLSPHGYPVPFIQLFVDGIPDFRHIDSKKQLICIDQKLCAVCGLKLYKGAYYFIVGDQGALTPPVSLDPAMHGPCAEWSMKLCPHMYFEKKQFRLNDLPAGSITFSDGEKPKTLLLIKADKFKMIRDPKDRGNLVEFREVSRDVYTYVDGLLTLTIQQR